MNVINDNVIIVAARVALNDYKLYGCYICQENRNFRLDSMYMAFYYKNKITRYIPQILGYIDSIDISNPNLDNLAITTVAASESEVKKRLNNFLTQYQNSKNFYFSRNKIIILSLPTDIRTVKLDHEIINNKTDKRGLKRVPFTQSNRYSTISKLRSSFYTKDLESLRD